MRRGKQNAERGLVPEAQWRLHEDPSMTLKESGLNQSSDDCSDSNRDSGVNRRLGMTAANLLMAGSLSWSTKPETKNGIPFRTLGRTGEKVSLVGLGGYHSGKKSNPYGSIRIIRTGIDEGINFLDNSWDYNADDTSVVIPGCDSLPILQQARHAARSFQAMDSSQVASSTRKNSRGAQTGQFGLCKTNHQFDGTVANPQWPG
jgi:hypothetical protein